MSPFFVDLYKNSKRVELSQMVLFVIIMPLQRERTLHEFINYI